MHPWLPDLPPFSLASRRWYPVSGLTRSATPVLLTLHLAFTLHRTVTAAQQGTDTAGVAAIRGHLAGIARAFAAGDFTIPGMVHAGAVPGTPVMAAKQGMIEYQFRSLDSGGEVRITTRDPEALRAIHEFLGFQRREHHAGGARHTEHL